MLRACVLFIAISFISAGAFAAPPKPKSSDKAAKKPAKSPAASVNPSKKSSDKDAKKPAKSPAASVNPSKKSSDKARTKDIKTLPKTTAKPASNAKGTKKAQSPVTKKKGGATETPPSKADGAKTTEKKAAEKTKDDPDDLTRCVRKPTLKKAKGPVKKKKISSGDFKLVGERKEWQAAVDRYVKAAIDYRKEARDLLKGFIAKRRKILNTRYGRLLKKAQKKAQDARVSAIAQFKAFIKKYPRDAKHTPDAMFRLAELYYEQTLVDHEVAEAKYDWLVDKYERGKIPSEPEPPEKSFKNVISTYRTLIKRFIDTKAVGKRYRYGDAVYYLLGYVLKEQKEYEGARTAWNALVANFPKSKYAPEVILRVGEMYFDDSEYLKAIATYKRAMKYPKSQYFDKALYKISWSYMQHAIMLQDAERVAYVDRAVRSFLKLIAWYDARSKGKKKSDNSLREEAVDYLGKSFEDVDWDGDGEPDPGAGLERALKYVPGNKPYEYEVLAAYAGALFETYDEKQFKEAIRVYNHLLKVEPLSPRAAKYQRQLIRIYDALRMIAEATDARKKLAAMFNKNSPWYDANKENTAVIADADKAVEKALRERALGHHQRARELRQKAIVDKDPALMEKAILHYSQAAEAYKEYLKRYPKAQRAYELSYYLSEVYFYAGRYAEAAVAYQKVAAHKHKTAYREPAGFSVTVALSREIQRLVREKKLSGRADPDADWQEPEPKAPPKTAKAKKTKKKKSGKKKIKAIPMPGPLLAWMKAVDFYVNNDLKKEGSRKVQAELAFAAGQMAFRYKNYPEARKRLKSLLACFPKSVEAANAIAMIINSYRAENDFANLEKWANIAEKKDLGDPKILAEIRKKIRLFKLDARFDKATALFKAKKFLAAAREFERLANEDKRSSNIDRAYFNAAIAYNKVKYYDSASRLFEKLVTDPRFKKSSFAADSLLNLAENYKLFFYFDKAITAYLAHFNRYPDSAQRPYVLMQAAILQENNGDYRQAAATYERYVKTFPTRKETPLAFFEVGILFEKLNDKAEQRRIWQEVIKRYSSQIGRDSLVLQAMLRLARMARKKGKITQAFKMYNRIISEYQRRGQKPNTSSAAAAAESKWELLERDFRKYEKLKIKGSVKRQRATMDKKQKLLNDLTVRYKELYPYKVADWTICSFYRQGELWRQFAETIENAPDPKGASDDELDEYQNLKDDFISKTEDIAVSKLALTVDKAREMNVTGKCAAKALAIVTKFKPDKYPMFKKELRRYVFDSPYSVDPSAKDLKKKK